MLLKIVVTILTLPLSFLLISCKKVDGTIYYTDLGSSVHKIDLQTKQDTLVYGDPWVLTSPSVHRINYLSDDRLFGFIYVTSITVFDINDRKASIICAGENPLYVKEINSFFYYKKHFNKEENAGLAMRKFPDGKESLVTKNIYTHRPAVDPNYLLYPRHPAVQISNSEIAYYNKDRKIELYNFLEKKFRTLDVVGCVPWAFSKTKNALICADEVRNWAEREARKFYFVNILTSEKEKLKIKRPHLVDEGIIPVDKHGCLIYSKVRMFSLSERQDMYIYWIRQGREQKYMKDVYIRSGVYLDK